MRVSIDAREQRVNRPQGNEAQTCDDSAKKKAHVARHGEVVRVVARWSTAA